MMKQRFTDIIQSRWAMAAYSATMLFLVWIYAINQAVLENMRALAPAFGQLAQEPLFSEAQAGTINEMLFMLTSFLVGQFILIGLVIRQYADDSKTIPFIVVLLLIPFLGLCVSAGTHIYAIRMLVIQQIFLGQLDNSALDPLIADAASALSISFFLAAYIFIYLLISSRHQQIPQSQLK